LALNVLAVDVVHPEQTAMSAIQFLPDEQRQNNVGLKGNRRYKVKRRKSEKAASLWLIVFFFSLIC
jgi:hypothetical protein